VGNPPIPDSPVPRWVTMAQPDARFGPYVTEKLLGRGGSGEVWRAYDTGLARPVALKILKHADPGQVARFKNEARTAAKLVHSSIVAVYEVGEDQGRHFIAMQLVVGGSLRGVKSADPRPAVEIVRDAARAVHYAHGQGVVHRDLKPDNILVEEQAGVRRAFVTDFGLARPLGHPEGGSSPSLSGTAAYMAPEQAKGGECDARSDVYSLGATLYEALEGRAPFEGRTLFDVLRQVAEEEPPPVGRGELGAIVARAMEKDPARRYAAAGDLAGDLDRWLRGEPVLARRSSVVYRLRKRLAKRKAIVATAVAGVLLAAGLTAWLAPMMIGASRERERAERYRAAFSAAMDRVNPFLLAVARRSSRREDLGREAAAALEAAIAIDGRRPEAWIWLGRCRRILGGDAEECWERALAAEPGHGEALFERGRQRLDRYAFLRGDPPIHAVKGTRELRAETSEERGLRETGQADIDRARSAGIAPHLAAYLEGLSAFGRGDFAAAEDAFTAYLREIEWEADAYHLRARTRLALHKTGPAEEDFTRMVDLNPRSIAAYMARGQFYRETKRYDLAESDYLRVLDLDPASLAALRHLGVLYRGQKLYDKSLEMFTRAIQRNPRDVLSLVNRGNTYREMKRPDDALRDYSDAIAADPASVVAWRSRGYLHQIGGRLEEADADYTKAADLDAKQARTFQWRGETRLAQKRWAEALADLEKAVELDPSVREPVAPLIEKARAGGP